MAATTVVRAHPASVDLYWLPLGAGGAAAVRWSGRLYEAIAARRERREPCRLYHSALEIRLGGARFVIEMAPVWGNREPDRGVVGEGSVGLPWLGRSRYFRYETRRWRDGALPDAAQAVASPQRLSTDPAAARAVLHLVPEFPVVTWGRDELGAGEMWNSNSLTAWLLARSGHLPGRVRLPPHGRAPGWHAGLVVAARQNGPAALSPPVASGCRERRRDRGRPEALRYR